MQNQVPPRWMKNKHTARLLQQFLRIEFTKQIKIYLLSRRIILIKKIMLSQSGLNWTYNNKGSVADLICVDFLLACSSSVNSEKGDCLYALDINVS